jgi:hypothetical protein
VTVTDGVSELGRRQLLDEGKGELRRLHHLANRRADLVGPEEVPEHGVPEHVTQVVGQEGVGQGKAVARPRAGRGLGDRLDGDDRPGTGEHHAPAVGQIPAQLHPVEHGVVPR